MENQTLGNITKEQENLSAIIRTKVRFLCSHTNQKKNKLICYPREGIVRASNFFIYLITTIQSSVLLTLTKSEDNRSQKIWSICSNC